MAYTNPPFPSHLRLSVELVTPDDARRYLDTMHHNRTKSRLDISVQVENLKAGTWYPDISPVYIDGGDPELKQDRAWDGQHRFEAIAASRVPAYLVFIRGVREEAARYADTGRKRTFSDRLRLADVPDYKRQSVLARILALYEKFGIESVRVPAKYPVTPAQMEAFVDAPGVHLSIKLGQALYRATGVNEHMAAYAAYRTAQRDPGGAVTVDPDGFWEDVRLGADLSYGNPALTLHNWLMLSKRGDGRTPSDKRLMALYALATCWNKHVVGAEYKKIQPKFEYRGDGSPYFPASAVPDFLPLGAGKKMLEPLKQAHAALRQPPVQETSLAAFSSPVPPAGGQQLVTTAPGTRRRRIVRPGELETPQ